MEILVLRRRHPALPVAVVAVCSMAFGALLRTQQTDGSLPVCCRMVIDHRDDNLRDALVNLAFGTEVGYPAPYRVAAIAKARSESNTGAPIARKFQLWCGVAWFRGAYVVVVV